MKREDIFVSDGLKCAAWLYTNPGAQSDVCIVMAHGFGGTRHYGLDAFARRFFDAGYDVLLFDFRHFGESEGLPRGLIEVERQIADWHAAIKHARMREYKKLVLWGTSFSGGHVLRVAAETQDVSAIISQVPHVSGWASARATSPKKLPRLIVAMFLDSFLRLFKKYYFVRAFAPEGSLAAMSTPGAHEVLLNMLPQDGKPPADPNWPAYFDKRNWVTALSLVEVMRYSPGRWAQKIRCPVFLLAATMDQTTPFDAARLTAQEIKDCEFHAIQVDHFDVYLGKPFEESMRLQLDFLERRMGSHTGNQSYG